MRAWCLLGAGGMGQTSLPGTPLWTGGRAPCREEAVVLDLVLPAAVGVHDPDVELGEVGRVALEDDASPVRRVRAGEIMLGERVGQLHRVGTVGVDRPDLSVLRRAAVGPEEYPGPIRRPVSRLGTQRLSGDLVDIRPVRVHDPYRRCDPSLPEGREGDL